MTTLHSDATDEDVRELAALAKERFDRKDFLAAMARYGELRRAEPKNGFYADRFGYCFIALKRWSDARDVWLEIIEDLGISKGRVNYVLQCALESYDYECADEFVRQYQEACGSDPTFIIYRLTAALGCRRLAEATEVFAALEPACPADRLPAILAQLGYRLLVLARHGLADIVIAFIDHVLPSLVDPAALLDAGARAANAGKRWQSQLRYLDQLIDRDPAIPARYLEKANTLIALGKGAECLALLADFATRFPPPLRTGDIEQRLQGLDIRAQSMSVWQIRLAEARAVPSFQGLTFRAEAHAALNRHHEAIEIARCGLSLYGDHPWFQFLIGKSHDALGETEQAVQWLSKATSGENPSTTYLIALLRAQVKAVDTEGVARTATLLRMRHGPSPFILSILQSLGIAQEESPASRAGGEAETAQEAAAWLHGGDSGDLVYSLASMQAAGGGRLYLTCIDATREPMDGRKIDFLAPLLAAQSYVFSVAPWQGEPITRDFNVMRNMMLPDVDLATMHWRAVMESGELDVTAPWLRAPCGQRHGRPVFARSSRYRNPQWDAFWEELKASSPDAIFVGTTAEFDEFRHGEHCLAQDALELARIIQGASVFVGNQSLPYAIAEGLKVGRLLEASPYVKNCLFPRALALSFETSRFRA